jgi:hypothetical protein
MSLEGILLANAITTHMRNRAIHEGIVAMVEAYYEEYTDATDLYQPFADALIVLGKHMDSFDEEDVAEAVREGEANMRANGREAHSPRFDDPEDED